MAWYADKLIAPSGGDYTTLSAFETAYDGEDLTGTDGVRARLKGTDGTSTPCIYWLAWSAGQSSSCKIVVEAESGYETDGFAGDGSNATIVKNFLLYGSSSGDLYVEVHGIEFADGRIGSSSSFTGGDIEITKCLFAADSTEFPVYFASTSTLAVKFGGCLIINAQANYGAGIRCADADATILVVNSTIGGCYYRGLSEEAGALTGHNVAVVDCNDDINGTITETDNTVLTQDDGDLSAVDGVDFTEPSADDYTIADTDSALYEAGTEVTDTWFTDRCSTDFAGTAWRETPAVGCFEYTAAGPSGLSIPVAYHHYQQMMRQ